MTETRTERGSCRFTAQEVEGGKQAIVVQAFHETIGPPARGDTWFESSVGNRLAAG
jgi:hypothetical protein